MLGSRELHPTADQPRQLDEWLRAEHDSGGLGAVIAVPAVLEVNPRSDLIASRGVSLALLRRLEPRAGALRSRSLGRRDSWPTAARCPTAPQWPAFTGLVRALAAELRGTSVTTNAVRTGSTATSILDESARLYGLESAEGVLFTAADRASSAPTRSQVRPPGSPTRRRTP
jgi:hypothetical protein